MSVLPPFPIFILETNLACQVIKKHHKKFQPSSSKCLEKNPIFKIGDTTDDTHAWRTIVKFKFRRGQKWGNEQTNIRHPPLKNYSPSWTKSLDDGKVWNFQWFFLFCRNIKARSKTSKRDPKPQSSFQNVKEQSEMSKCKPKLHKAWAEKLKHESASQNVGCQFP